MLRQVFNIYGVHRTDESEQNTIVFASIDDLIDYWNSGERAGNLLVHIGTVSPGLPEDWHEHDIYPGHVLVSEAALWHFPESYEANEKPLFTLSLGENGKSVPVRRFTKGWHYEVKMKEVEEESAIDDDNWHSALVSDLSSGKQVPFESMINRAPLWFLGVPVMEIEFPARVRNVLKRQQVKHVGDFIGLDSSSFMRWSNFGKNSMKDLESSLIFALLSPDPEWLSYTAPIDVLNRRRAAKESSQGTTEKDGDLEGDSRSVSTSSPIESASTLSLALDLWLKDFVDERSEKIFRQRYGIGFRSDSLDNIAESFGLTRQRILQLDKKVQEKFAKSSLYTKVHNHLRNVLWPTEKPIYLDMLHGYDKWLELEFHDARGAQRFFSLWSDIVSVIDNNGSQIIVGPTSFKSFAEARKAIQKQVSGIAGNYDDAVKRISTFCVTHGLESLEATFVQELIGEDSNSEGNEILVVGGTSLTLEQAVEAVLRKSNKPLKISAIKEQVESLVGRTVPLESIRASARNIGLLFSPSTYGLESHILLSEVERKIIVNYLSQRIEEGDTSRQWHAHDLSIILENHLKHWNTLPTKYEVNAILRADSKLKYLGRLVWTSTNGEDTRFEVGDLLFKILREHGGPLNENRLVREISNYRGLNKYIQFFPSERVGRLTGSLWGLVTRDYGLNYPEIIELKKKIAQILDERELSPIDVSSLWFKIGKIPADRDIGSLKIHGPELLKGLIQTFERFDIDADGKVGYAD